MIGRPEDLIPWAPRKPSNPEDDSRYYQLEKKPLLLRLFTKYWQWTTISPYIYYPVGLAIEWNPLVYVETLDKDVLQYGTQINPIHLPILKHEVCHLTQQNNLGKWRFLFSYIFSRRFRLAAEAEAIAVELMWRQPNERWHYASAYASDLAGRAYFWAAPSQFDALNAITSKVTELGWGRIEL